MNKLFYPALFHKAEEGGYWVSFPDIPECLTEGDDMDDAYEMAVDALGLCIIDDIKEGIELRKPSNPSEIEVDDDSIVVIVCFDLEAYQRKQSSRAVKKTLTIPEWLNEEALALNINFSQVLQKALINEIQSLK